MPMISTKTTSAITKEQELQLKSRLGEAIAILPGKSEQWLMTSFEDNCRMYFRGDNSEPLAFIEVQVFGKINPSAADRLTAEICNIFGSVLGISSSNIYVKYEEVAMWGWNDGNF
ncbi:MAG: phenylpyruvate tautomerase MIF-related protein [Clostridia bacterium]|nr:phenylpyruvate tautomerase MIF-related protein [Clostridia bacterium]